MKKLNWKAYSKESQHVLLDQIKRVISHSNGYITHFNLFSDIAISLTIEIEEKDIISLLKSLNEIITIDADSEFTLDLHSTQEWLIFLNISFSSGTGDLKREVISVPG